MGREAVIKLALPSHNAPKRHKKGTKKALHLFVKCLICKGCLVELGGLNPVRHLSIAGLFRTKPAILRPSRSSFWPLPALSG